MKNNILTIIQERKLPLQLSFKQCSKLCGYSVWTIRKWEANGTYNFPRGRRKGNSVRINTAKFLKWLDIQGE